MRKVLFIILVLVMMMALAGPALADPPSCNWGELTSSAIAGEYGDYDQGQHSSDPTGDGHGPGTADEPRAGLGNVAGDGDLEATCVFIESQLP